MLEARDNRFVLFLLLLLLFVCCLFACCLLFRYYQTLRLWLEEPRLHGSALYLPALPPQYDSNRLELIMQGNKVQKVKKVKRVKSNSAAIFFPLRLCGWSLCPCGG